MRMVTTFYIENMKQHFKPSQPFVLHVDGLNRYCTLKVNGVFITFLDPEEGVVTKLVSLKEVPNKSGETQKKKVEGVF